eukprot:GAHX01000451.1.p1 GENE.GAHX01000451.1~~GAHX01000451.1.p1  ORF type:complete len:744 (-),score=159.76 GAHX01000451.1:25-2256(-)
MFSPNRNPDEKDKYNDEGDNDTNRRHDDRYWPNDRSRDTRRNDNYQRGGRYQNRPYSRGYDDEGFEDNRRPYNRDDRYNEDGYRSRRGRRSYDAYSRPAYKPHNSDQENYRSKDIDNDRNSDYRGDQRTSNYQENDTRRGYSRDRSFPYNRRARNQYYNPQPQGGPMQRYFMSFNRPMGFSSNVHGMIPVKQQGTVKTDENYFENLRKARQEAAKDARESLKEAQSKEQNMDLSTVIDTALASSVSNAFTKAKKQHNNREIQRRRSESFSKDFFQAHKNTTQQKKTTIVITMTGLWSYKNSDVKECNFDDSFANLFNKDITASTNYPWVSETRGLFGRKSVRDMKFSKSESMNLLAISDRIQLIRSSVNSILNKLTPDTMNVLSSELVGILTVNRETKLKKEEELYMVTQLIVKNALLVHKYSPQLAMLCAILFGRIKVQSKNFNDTLYESIFDEFIMAINEEEATEQSIPETRGIFIFLANLYNAKVMSDSGIIDVIMETAKKNKHPNFCLFIECLIQMATIISTKNEDVKSLKFDLIKDAVREFIDSHDKTDKTDRLKFRMLDLNDLINGNRGTKEEEEEKVEEHNNEELQEIFVKWYKADDKSSAIKNSNKSVFKDFHAKIFILFVHLLGEDGEERKQVSTFLNDFIRSSKNGHLAKKSLNKAVLMLLIMRADFELDTPNYFEIITGMFKGINTDWVKGWSISFFLNAYAVLQSIGYEIEETKLNVDYGLNDLKKSLLNN